MGGLGGFPDPLFPQHYSLCALEDTLALPQFLHLESTAWVGASKGSFTLFLPRGFLPLWLWGRGLKDRVRGRRPACKQPPHALPCSVPAVAPPYQFLPQVRGCTEALPWSGISPVPSSTCHSGRSGQGTVRQAWAPTPHLGLLSPGDMGFGPASWQGVGGEAARNSLVFPGQVNRFQFYHKLVSPHG